MKCGVRVGVAELVCQGRRVDEGSGLRYDW
jgi:hypothetical protein